MSKRLKPSHSSLLLIFTRNPEPGKCKTRLAATIGDTAALEIYRFLVRHTAKITRPLASDKHVYYSDAVELNDYWDPAIYMKKVQRGNDLGERMRHAFSEGFDAGYTKVVIIGSDMYDLSTKDLEIAFEKLETDEVVIGPARDGGYYLLGMRSPEDAVFRNKAWGTDKVLRDTLNDLKERNVALLDVRNDIDVYEDIRNKEVFKPFLKS